MDNILVAHIVSLEMIKVGIFYSLGLLTGVLLWGLSNNKIDHGKDNR